MNDDLMERMLYKLLKNTRLFRRVRDIIKLVLKNDSWCTCQKDSNGFRMKNAALCDLHYHLKDYKEITGG